MFAINLIESIKDYYPEAQVALVTEERFLDGREECADHIILCNDHYRAKLWGMANSPFDRTFYIDADAEVQHEDIADVFDLLGDDDMVFTHLCETREYVFKETSFPGGRMDLCGGVCLYNSASKRVMQFMQDWYQLYVDQWSDAWWPTKNGEWDTITYPRSLKYWDQFSLWWLTEKEDKYEDIRISIFDNDARWNYYSLYHDYLDHTNGTPIVITHYSSGCEKDIPIVGSLAA